MILPVFAFLSINAFKFVGRDRLKQYIANQFQVVFPGRQKHLYVNNAGKCQPLRLLTYSQSFLFSVCVFDIPGHGPESVGLCESMLGIPTGF